MKQYVVDAFTDEVFSGKSCCRMYNKRMAQR